VGGPSSASRKWATTFVVARSFFLHPPLTPVTPRLPLPPPPSRPNASRRWLLSSFRCDCHHHLPRFQTRAGGVVSTRLPPPPPPSHANASRRWFFLSFRHDIAPAPPPSLPNASRRRFFLSFRHDSHHHHHLPRVQTRAGGGSFRRFDMTPPPHLPRVQTRAGGGFFRSSDTSPTTTTSLASKREPEVVILGVSTRLPPPSPPSRPNVSRRWFFSAVSTRLPPPRDMREEEGQGATTTCSSSFPRALITDPPPICEGFSLMVSTKRWRSYHTPPHLNLFVVNNMYLGHTIKYSNYYT